MVIDIIDRLHEFNAADWHPRNTLKEFYLSFDASTLDRLKELMLNRITECKEIIDRKNKGLITGDLLRIVDDAFVADVREEARELRSLANKVEEVKIAYMER